MKDSNLKVNSAYKGREEGEVGREEGRGGGRDGKRNGKRNLGVGKEGKKMCMRVKSIAPTVSDMCTLLICAGSTSWGSRVSGKKRKMEQEEEIEGSGGGQKLKEEGELATLKQLSALDPNQSGYIAMYSNNWTYFIPANYPDRFKPAGFLIACSRYLLLYKVLHVISIQQKLMIPSQGMGLKMEGGGGEREGEQEQKGEGEREGKGEGRSNYATYALLHLPSSRVQLSTALSEKANVA